MLTTLGPCAEHRMLPIVPYPEFPSGCTTKDQGAAAAGLMVDSLFSGRAGNILLPHDLFLSCALSDCNTKGSHFSRVRLFATPQTVACQAPLSVGFCRQEYWSGLPCPPPGDLPDPGIKPRSPTLQTDSLPTEPPGKPIRT